MPHLVVGAALEGAVMHPLTIAPKLQRSLLYTLLAVPLNLIGQRGRLDLGISHFHDEGVLSFDEVVQV